jgi:hypothetical protein
MMAKEYKAGGGDYNTPKENQDESQKHLSKWCEEEWQTEEGSAHAKQDDGTRKRYLPKKAWEERNEEEKEVTEQKKQEGSKEGHQFVQNTARAKAARKNANEAEDEKYEKEKKTEQEKVRSGRQTRSSTRMEQAQTKRRDSLQRRTKSRSNRPKPTMARRMITRKSSPATNAVAARTTRMTRSKIRRRNRKTIQAVPKGKAIPRRTAPSARSMTRPKRLQPKARLKTAQERPDCALESDAPLGGGQSRRSS